MGKLTFFGRISSKSTAAYACLTDENDPLGFDVLQGRNKVYNPSNGIGLKRQLSRETWDQGKATSRGGPSVRTPTPFPLSRTCSRVLEVGGSHSTFSLAFPPSLSSYRSVVFRGVQ